MIPTIKEVGDYAAGCGYDAATVHDWFERMESQAWTVKDSPVQNWMALLDGKMRHEAAIKPAPVASSGGQRLSYSLFPPKRAEDKKAEDLLTYCVYPEASLQSAWQRLDGYTGESPVTISAFQDDIEAAIDDYKVKRAWFYKLYGRDAEPNPEVKENNALCR